jgi:predicted small metal-binding protein
VQTDGRKVALTNNKETVMAKVIRCQCGFLGRGESVEEAVTVIEAHMRSDHPELVGKVTREDLIAMAEEA